MKCAFKLCLLLLFLGVIPFYGQSDSLSYFFGKNTGNNASSYILTGKIIDDSSREPIEGVGFHIDGTYSGISSDRFGTYLVNLEQEFTGSHLEAYRRSRFLHKLPFMKMRF
ncbi:hypothetical protein AAGF08_14585 [Algoriphagus sp. SE2]|uniref:hypothetical protein n=1 Tax=Algoriphagus sp. SE2 TaxID=3141536 RepID=UPI0031CD33FA